MGSLEKVDEAIRSIERGVLTSKKPLKDIQRRSVEEGQEEIEEIFYRYDLRHKI